MGVQFGLNFMPQFSAAIVPPVSVPFLVARESRELVLDCHWIEWLSSVAASCTSKANGRAQHCMNWFRWHRRIEPTPQLQHAAKHGDCIVFHTGNFKIAHTAAHKQGQQSTIYFSFPTSCILLFVVGYMLTRNNVLETT